MFLFRQRPIRHPAFLIFVPKSEVIEMDMSVEEAIKFVISGGIVNPEEEEDK